MSSQTKTRDCQTVCARLQKETQGRPLYKSLNFVRLKKKFLLLVLMHQEFQQLTFDISIYEIVFPHKYEMNRNQFHWIRCILIKFLKIVFGVIISSGEVLGSAS